MPRSIDVVDAGQRRPVGVGVHLLERLLREHDVNCASVVSRHLKRHDKQHSAAHGGNTTVNCQAVARDQQQRRETATPFSTLPPANHPAGTWWSL